MARIAILLLALMLCGPLTAAADVPPPPGQDPPPRTLTLTGAVMRVDASGFEVDGRYVWTQTPPGTFGLQTGDRVEVTASRGGVRYFATLVFRLRGDGSREVVLDSSR